MRPDDTTRCSFCGGTQGQVRETVVRAGNNNMYICGKCIELCSEILEEELEGQNEGESPALANIHLLKPREIRAFLDECVIEQNGTKKVSSVAVYNHYERVMACQNMDVDTQKNDILMLGPTGSGKTYLTQTLVKILNVPSAITDTTALTEVGYVGEDVENILLKFIQVASCDIPRAEYGTIYIDEIGKTIKKSENISIARDVSGEGIQQTLLKILESIVTSVPPQDGRKHPHQKLPQIDTTNILLICDGVSNGLEKIVEQRLSAGSIGSNAEATSEDDLNIGELLRRVEPKDLTKFGLIPEFIGHVLVMVPLEQPIKEVMVRILSEPKNALMRQHQKLFELNNVKPEFTREALEGIAQLAVDRKIGTRGLHSILEPVMMDFMYEIPSDGSIGIRTITRDVVRRAGQPELVYHDIPPVSTQEPLSEQLREDSRIGEVVQAAIFL